MSASQALMVLRTTLGVRQRSHWSNAADPYEEAIELLPPDCVVVLDDMPRLTGDDLLVDQLVTLTRIAQTQGVRIVSTSRFDLPARFLSLIESHGFVDQAVPPFDDSEIREVLESHSAPADVIQADNVRFIQGVTSGHPLLIALACRYLAERKWQIQKVHMDALIRGEHSTDVVDEALHRIAQSLPVPQRELLYRMSLATRHVPQQVAIALGNVQEPVLRPRETLGELVGAWIQRSTEWMYSVSPLLADVGRDNLSQGTFLECHRVFGREIVQESMSPWDGQAAIFHFVEAGEINLAGDLYISLLEQIRRWPIELAFLPLLRNWSDCELPREMDLRRQLILRITQAWALSTYRTPYPFAVADLDRLLQRATVEQAKEVRLVVIITVMFLGEHNFPVAIRLFSAGMRVVREAVGSISQIRLPQNKELVELLWHSAIHTRSLEEITLWLDAIEGLTDSERKTVLQSDEAVLGTVVFADRLMIIESDEPETGRDWNRVIINLKSLRDRAKKTGWAYLEACLLRTEINVHGEFLKSVESCQQTVKTFVGDDSRLAEHRSLVAGMFGKMLAGAGQHRAARSWLDRSLKSPLPHLPHDHMLTLLAAAKCAADSDGQAALEYTESAAALAYAEKIVPVQSARAHGEHAIAMLGREHNRKTALRAYPAWSRAMEAFQRSSRDEADWRETLIVLSIVQHHLVSFALYGRSSDVVADLPREPIHQGMFFSSNPLLGAFAKPDVLPSLMWMQSQFARAANDDESASLWLRRADEALAGQPETLMSSGIRLQMVTELLLADEYGKAIEAAIVGSTGMIVSSAMRRANDTEALGQTRLRTLAKSLSEEYLIQIDRYAIGNGLIPAVLRLAHIAINDSDSARSGAEELAAICRQVAENASDAHYWLGTASILQEVADGSSVSEIAAITDEFADSDHPEVSIVARLAVMLTGNPGEIFNAQVSTMRNLFEWFKPSMEVYRKLLLPLIKDYWTGAIKQSPSSFLSIAHVEKELRTAFKTRRRDRVVAILKVIHSGLKAPPDHDVVKWLLDIDAKPRSNQDRRRSGKQELKVGNELNRNNQPDKKKRKLGRNARCPCGSGHKYKKCCGR